MHHILIVDDQEENLYYLKSLLEGNGFKTTSARHGAEALVHARKNPPDFIISDLLMPVMDGYTLLRHWKSDDVLKKIPFIVYTATYTEAEDEKLAFDLGADAFILKPTEPEVFLEKIGQWLGPNAQVTKTPNIAATDEFSTNQNYNITLIRKLEKKMLDLEESHRIVKREQAELKILDRAVRSVSQGIVMVDALQPDLPIIYVSPGFEKMTGYSMAEVIGKNCRFLQGAETDAQTVAQIRTELAAQNSLSVEILNYHKDGHSFWNHLVISPVKDKNGKVTQFVGIQSDITERRQLEGQLRQSQKMEAIGSLAGGIAHDFNNILAIIGLHIETLLTKVDAKSPLRAGLDSILSAQNRGATLTRQLLTFSRKQTIALKPISIDETIKGLMSMLGRLIGENINLQADFGPESKIVSGDVGQIEQLVTNLVVNARDAIVSKGDGQIFIRTSRVIYTEPSTLNAQEVKPGSYVQLLVADTGCGISETTLSRIFEPFFTTKEVGKGTGLGLAIVYSLVRQANGYIDVQSQINIGTTFTILLPLAEVVNTEANDRKTSKYPQTAAADRTILITEDDAALREILSLTLQSAGYKVMTAANGLEALELYKQHSSAIDMVITDVVMPKMGGRELSEKINHLSQNGVKILFLSGYTDDTLLRYEISGTASNFLDKPFTVATFLDKVSDILNGH